MRRQLIWFAVCAALLAAVGLSPLGVPVRAQGNANPNIQGEQLKPIWKIGDRWVVETRSWQLQARRGGPAERGPGIQWQFHVQAAEKIGQQDCLRVEVQCLLAGRAQPVTKLWVDQRSMALRQIQTQLPVAGTFRTVTESYQFQDGQPSPILAPLTALPLDLPLFLGGQVKGNQTFSYEAFPGPSGAKAPTDVSFAYEIQQSVTTAQPEQVKGLLHEEFAKSLGQPGAARSDSVDVRLETAGRKVRQIWQPGLPWPAFSDNGATESRLVQVTRQN